MLKFIANFIVFGVLFYLIYVYFPDQFHILTTWAESIVNFVKDLFHAVMDKVGTHPTAPPTT